MDLFHFRLISKLHLADFQVFLRGGGGGGGVAGNRFKNMHITFQVEVTAF